MYNFALTISVSLMKGFNFTISIKINTWCFGDHFHFVKMVSDLLHNPIFLHRERKTSNEIIRRENLRPWPPIYRHHMYNKNTFTLHRQYNSAVHPNSNNILLNEPFHQLSQFRKNSDNFTHNLTKAYRGQPNLIDKNNCMYFNNNHQNDEDIDFERIKNNHSNFIKNNKKNIRTR
jgi:hypothetical protein